MSDKRIITAKDIKWTIPREGILRGAYNNYHISIIRLNAGGWAIAYGCLVAGNDDHIHVWDNKQSAKEAAIEIINSAIDTGR